MSLTRSVHLIVYPDRIGRNLKDLESFLAGPVGLLLHVGVRSWQGWRGIGKGTGHAR